MTTTFSIIKRDGTVLDVLVDDEDWDEVRRHRWFMAGGKGSLGKYAMNAEGIYLHRLIAFRAGIIPSLAIEKGQRGRWSQSIDHENGNKLDCRRTNLRLRTRQQQMLNPNDGLRSTNRSGYRGVSFVKGRVRKDGGGYPWMAYVQHDGKSKNLGWYATPEEAAAARRHWDVEQEAAKAPAS